MSYIFFSPPWLYYVHCFWSCTWLEVNMCWRYPTFYSCRYSIQRHQSSSATIKWKSNRASPKKGLCQSNPVFIVLWVYIRINLFPLFFHFIRWVEEDPKEILQSVYECMERTCEKLTQLNIDISNIKGTWTQVSDCYFSRTVTLREMSTVYKVGCHVVL